MMSDYHLGADIMFQIVIVAVVLVAFPLVRDALHTWDLRRYAKAKKEMEKDDEY